MNKIIIISTVTLLALLGCNSKKSESEKSEKGKPLVAEAFDPIKYLDGHNTSRRLYKGTETYFETLKKEKVILEQNYRTELFNDEDINSSKIDSIRSWHKNDTLFISHIFMARGRCLNVFPHIVESEKLLQLNAPEIMNGEVEIENGDTLTFDEGCSLENIIEFTFKLPIAKLPKKAKMLYNGTEIKAYNTVYGK